MQIKKTTTINQKMGRNNKPIVAIVDHITAGAFPGCLNWMKNPDSKSSAHYLITRGGEIYQLVEDQNTAWHAGSVNQPTWKYYDGTNPNSYTIGIEHENAGGGKLTEEQYQATLWLHRYLIQKHGLPVDRDHIIGHCEIDSINRKNCPGKDFPWERLMRDLIQGEEEEMPRYNTLEEVPVWAKETIRKLVEKGILSGNGSSLDLSADMLRVLVMMDRAGGF